MALGPRLLARSAVSGEVLAELVPEPTDSVATLKGQISAAAGLSGTLTLLSGSSLIPDCGTLRDVGLEGQSEVLVVSLGQATVLTASEDGSARTWDPGSCEQMLCLTGHTAPVRSVRPSRDRALLATASDDGQARLWRTEGGACLSVLPDPAGSRNYSAEFSPDGRTLVTATGDCCAKLWDVETAKLSQTLRGNRGLRYMPADRDALGHYKDVVSACFSPDGGTVLTGSDDGSAKLWSVSDGACRTTIDGHSGGAAACFSPDGMAVATGSVDRRARTWDVRTGGCLLTLWHDHAVHCVDVSPDGRLLATGSDDSSMKLWDLVTGRCRQTSLGHAQGVLSVAFAADGRSLATASRDGKAKLWAAKGGYCLGDLLGHAGPVTSVRWL